MSESPRSHLERGGSDASMDGVDCFGDEAAPTSKAPICLTDPTGTMMRPLSTVGSLLFQVLIDRVEGHAGMCT